MPLDLQRRRTALLLMDFQNDMALEGGKLGPEGEDAVLRHKSAMGAARRALISARAAEMFVAHVVVHARPAKTGPKPHTPMMETFQRLQPVLPGSKGARIVDGLAPEEGEPIFIKHAVSAFAGTSLDEELRLRRIDTVLLAGLVTHFVVEGTARDATDRGFRVVVVQDACSSQNQERHEASLSILRMIGTLTDSVALASGLIRRDA